MDREQPDSTRLLLFTNSVQIGGMEEHVRLLAKDLDRSRFSVAVVFPDWDETNPFADSLHEVADSVDHFTPDRRRGAVAAAKETVRFFRFIRREHFDVAHLHSTTFKGQWLALLALRAGGVKRIFVTEHLAPEHAPSKLRYLRRRAFGKLVTGLVCVSERNREARVKFLHTPVETTHVVVNGIDVERFDRPEGIVGRDETRAAHGIASSAPVVGTAIRLEPGKGVADLVDAFGIVRSTHPEAVLLVVGDGALRDDLEAQVARLGLTESVVFTGFVTDPRSLIRAMDVFVLPVPFGSASIGLLEAMAMSRASVITFGGPGEAIEHGVSGFWAEPSNPASIAHFVGRLLDDPDLRRSVEIEARQRIERDFSSQRVADELSQLYLGSP